MSFGMILSFFLFCTLFSFLSKLLRTVPSTTTMNINIPFIFGRLFSSNNQVFVCCFFFSLSFIFTVKSAEMTKSTTLFFLLINTWSGFLAGIRWYICIVKSQRIVSVSFIIIIIYSFRIFLVSVSWWFFTGVWVTASLLKSPGLFSVFCPFSVMLSFG